MIFLVRRKLYSSFNILLSMLISANIGEKKLFRMKIGTFAVNEAFSFFSVQSLHVSRRFFCLIFFDCRLGIKVCFIVLTGFNMKPQFGKFIIDTQKSYLSTKKCTETQLFTAKVLYLNSFFFKQNFYSPIFVVFFFNEKQFVVS